MDHADSEIIGMFDPKTDLDRQQALARSAAHLAALVSSSSDAIISKDLNGIVTSWNPSAERIFGYGAEEMIGQSIRVLIPEDRQSEEDSFLARIKNGERIDNFHTIRRRKDGEQIYLAVTISPIHDSTGKIIGASKIAHDITAQKLAAERERELVITTLAATAKFESVFNQSGIYAGILDIDGNLREVNKLSLDFCGYTREQVIGRPFSETPWWRGSDVEREKIRSAVKKAASGESFREQLRYWLADGSERIIDFAIHPIRDASGVVCYLHPTGLDITERKESEEKIRAGEDNFRTLADNIHQFAWMAEASGSIYWYNKRWFDYTGTTLPEMEGWGWTAVHHPDHIDRVVEKISQSFEAGTPWEDTFPLRSAAGEYRWFLSRALPIRNARGEVVRWFGTNTDITDRLEAEEHQKLLTRELNHRVRNNLMTVQAIAGQCLTGDKPLDQAREEFVARLHALSRLHTLLSADKWQGASLKKVLAQSLEPYGYSAGRTGGFDISGPDVRLSSRSAQTFAIAFHELASNASKYGSLSTPLGRLKVEWSVNPDRSFSLLWKESEGPDVQPPARRGFGTKMITQLLASEIGGEIAISHDKDGLGCKMAGWL